jgi:hypothetical protein
VVSGTHDLLLANPEEPEISPPYMVSLNIEGHRKARAERSALSIDTGSPTVFGGFRDASVPIMPYKPWL